MQAALGLRVIVGTAAMAHRKLSLFFVSAAANAAGLPVWRMAHISTAIDIGLRAPTPRRACAPGGALLQLDLQLGGPGSTVCKRTCTGTVHVGLAMCDRKPHAALKRYSVPRTLAVSRGAP